MHLWPPSSGLGRLTADLHPGIGPSRKICTCYLSLIRRVHVCMCSGRMTGQDGRTRTCLACSQGRRPTSGPHPGSGHADWTCTSMATLCRRAPSYSATAWSGVTYRNRTCYGVRSQRSPPPRQRHRDGTVGVTRTRILPLKRRSFSLLSYGGVDWCRPWGSNPQDDRFELSMSA